MNKNKKDIKFRGNGKVRVDLGGVNGKNGVNLVNIHCMHAYNLKELPRKYCF